MSRSLMVTRSPHPIRTTCTPVLNLVLSCHTNSNSVYLQMLCPLIVLSVTVHSLYKAEILLWILYTV